MTLRTLTDALDSTEALEHYRILSETAFDYAFKTRIGPDGVPIVEWMSESWARDFGYEPEGPKELFGGVHPDDREQAAEQWAELMAGRPIEGEIRLLLRSGDVLWVHHRTRPIIEPDSGRMIGTYGALLNINDRKAAEELWRQAEARFRAQYQASPIPTYTWQRLGDDFVMIDYNQAAHDMTRGGVVRLLGKSARQLYSDEDPEIIADLERCFETGQAIRKQMPGYRLRSTGQIRDLLVTVACVPPTLVMVHTIDVTELRRSLTEGHEPRARLGSEDG